MFSKSSAKGPQWVGQEGRILLTMSICVFSKSACVVFYFFWLQRGEGWSLISVVGRGKDGEYFLLFVFVNGSFGTSEEDLGSSLVIKNYLAFVLLGRGSRKFRVMYGMKKAVYQCFINE